jgi:hypothetical protein
MLSLGKFKECNLSPTDVDAARSLLGDCTACISANMPEPPSPASQREPPRADGESFHADIFFVKNGDARKSPYLLVVDERCGMLIGRFLGQRGAKVLHPAMDTIVNHIHGMLKSKPSRIFTDRERVFMDFQAYKGVKVIQSAPNRLGSIAERNFETVKDAMRAKLASLQYKLPDHLYRYLVDWVIQRRNLLINSKSNPLTPAEIYGCRQFSPADIKRTDFGTTVFFKVPKDQVEDDTAPQTEFGIVVGYESNNPNNLKVYIPSRGQVVIRAHFKPVNSYELFQTKLLTMLQMQNLFGQN